MDILRALAGSDRRSIGRVGEVVPFVLDHPEQLGVLMSGMVGEDPVLRMRCADAAEKISAKRPEWLRPFRSRLVQLAQSATQQELRWHLAQMLPRIGLEQPERDLAVALLFRYLDDKSRIVTTSSLTSLAAFARDDPALRRKLMPILQRFAAEGSAAERNRAGKLLKGVVAAAQ